MAFGISWLKTELDNPKYWLHLAILATIVFFIIDLFADPISIVVGNMLTIKNVLYSIPLLAIADTVAHSVLNLN